MDVAYSLLGFLGLSPNYGYELKKQYDVHFGGEKPILSGQIYATLSRLLRDGKVREVESTEESGGPKRVKYAITPVGSQALQLWLQEPELPSAHLQPTMYIKTITALLSDGDAARYLDAQRKAHLGRMRYLTNLRRDSGIAQKIQIDHTLFHLEADLRWIDLTSARLQELKGELWQKHY